MATDQSLNAARNTSTQAIVEFCQLFFWSFLGLLSLTFKFLHEVLKKLIAMKQPVRKLDAEQIEKSDAEHFFPEGDIVNTPLSRHVENAVAYEQPIPHAVIRDIPRFSCNSGMMHYRKKWYAVVKGRQPGLYECWEEAQQQVDGFSNAKYQAFKHIQEAKKYLTFYMLSRRGGLEPDTACHDYPHELGQSDKYIEEAPAMLFSLQK